VGMTRKARLEAELKMWLDSDDFAEAELMMARVADLRWRIVKEEYDEQYGATDRER
jgi:hypothetical protein